MHKGYEWENTIFIPLTLKKTWRTRQKYCSCTCTRANKQLYYLERLKHLHSIPEISIKGRDEYLTYCVLANI